MGEIAESMIEGECCDICGSYFEDPKTKESYSHGHPATCWDGWKELTKEEKKIHQRAEVDTF